MPTTQTTTNHTIALALGTFTIAALSALTPTQAQAQEKQEVTIPVVIKATTASYWQAVFDGAHQAADRLGIQIEELGPANETEVARQISIMENLVSRQPTAIVLAPVSNDALAGPVEAATDADIPVVIIDSGVDTDRYASLIATDNFAAGQRAGHALAECIEKTSGDAAGEVAYLRTNPNGESLVSRDNGFLDAMDQYPDIKVVDNRVANNDTAKAMNDTLDLLNRHPDLKGIFADNQLMGDGAGTAFAEQGAGDDVCLVAFDSSELEVDFLRQGIIDSLVVQDPYMMGYSGVWFAYAASQGVSLPRSVDTGVHVATTENVESADFTGLLDPSKRQLTPYLEAPSATAKTDSQ
ncbi:monosaccharide ABC transporter substrate-binding protein, CUT2 family [Chromohalobacter canadensis]|uniref:Monosaccharide ABC transporter substrate-binding protein, CUT2 family n=1 Tax=Chromohalobacter canadensis TaxID=141389 RepID=A0A285VTQ0_9GAMM|nr:ABC transporter substrate-binding protein [Chromohalobacter canadensis]SOC57424.1 monosaccharide ABC transporter substrate-binding protein, CUT2 family [Chromohalobacter canadensis]